MRIFGKGKCKFIARFSATMVTSLPSLVTSLIEGRDGNVVKCERGNDKCEFLAREVQIYRQF